MHCLRDCVRENHDLAFVDVFKFCLTIGIDLKGHLKLQAGWYGIGLLPVRHPFTIDRAIKHYHECVQIRAQDPTFGILQLLGIQRLQDGGLIHNQSFGITFATGFVLIFYHIIFNHELDPTQTLRAKFLTPQKIRRNTRNKTNGGMLEIERFSHESIVFLVLLVVHYATQSIFNRLEHDALTLYLRRSLHTNFSRLQHRVENLVDRHQD